MTGLRAMTIMIWDFKALKNKNGTFQIFIGITRCAFIGIECIL